MATSYRSRLLAVLRDNESRLAAVFAALAGQIAREIARRADTDGNVPRSATYDLQRAAGDWVMVAFLGRVGDERAPMQVLPDGRVLPLSPYAQALWQSIGEAVRIPVEQHAAIMRRRLPPDLLAVLERPPLVQEQGPLRRAFRSNPLAGYDPPHLWVDPAGYRLADRIWRTAGRTRRRLDLYLEEAIAQGRGALRMSRELERFLQPGRTLRTRAPYGTDASYDAMRLARTEITRAHARAAEVSASLNPFVAGVSVVLSPSHPKPDICDEAAAAGPWPVEQIPAEYQIPLHPQCMCSYRYEMVKDAADVVEALRAEVHRERWALAGRISPLQIERLTQALLGQWAISRALGAAA